MSFLLDTNICSAYISNERSLFSRFVQYVGNLHVSRISIAELYVWAYLSPKEERRLALISEFLETLDIVEFDDTCARHFGRLRRDLSRAGIEIGPVDTMLAATALAYDLTIVTHNRRHFDPVPNLRVVDWLDE